MAFLLPLGLQPAIAAFEAELAAAVVDNADAVGNFEIEQGMRLVFAAGKSSQLGHEQDLTAWHNAPAQVL
jgi:hypothetical protein